RRRHLIRNSRLAAMDGEERRRLRAILARSQRGTTMKTVLMTLAVAIVMVGLVSLAAADWKAPRTVWGEPDLEGTWTSQPELGVPFERPAEFGTRERLTDEEFAQRDAQARNQLKSD